MRKKTIIGLCAVLGVAVIAAAGVILYPFLFKNNVEPSPMPSPTPVKKAEQPDELLLRYFSGIDEGQYEAIYEMLDEQSQEYVPKEDFVTKNQNIYEGIEAENLSVSIGGIHDYERKPDDSEASSSASGDMKVVEYSVRMDTIAGEIFYTSNAVFTLNENEEYRMQWTIQSIFPNLNSGDKVRVNMLKAERGWIYDRNGEMLAGPGVASSVGFVPGKMRKSDDAENQGGGDSEAQSELTDGNAADTSERASTAYNTEDIAKIAELLETTSESILEKLNASYVKEDTFVQLKIVSSQAQELIDQLLTVPGILINDTAVRYYPLGEKAAHLVGYIQGISSEELETLEDQGYHTNSVVGKSGAEKIYEEQLRAVDGREIIIVDEDGNVQETLATKDKIDGTDITLTIDAQTQSQLYDQCAQDKSCSVAMNPKTGEVLALVSTPAFDANDFILGMSAGKWTALNEDESKPLYNRFQAALCPGSTMKALTAAIGINTGIISPSDDFGHSGLQWRKDESWGNYYITTTMEYEGPANIENALKFSDNIYFGKAALKIGTDTFREQLKYIGFEEKIPFEYGLYSSIISTEETFASDIQLADSGYGQGEILTNPVHLACVYSAFVNEGNMIQPRLNLYDDSLPKYWVENAFTADTAGIVRDSLIQVIESGSAADAKVDGMILAGKTGTAEIKLSKDDAGGTELGWFVMFTADDSADNPLLVITMIEDVKDRGGSHYVIPKVKAAFE